VAVHKVCRRLTGRHASARPSIPQDPCRIPANPRPEDQRSGMSSQAGPFAFRRGAIRKGKRASCAHAPNDLWTLQPWDSKSFLGSRRLSPLRSTHERLERRCQPGYRVPSRLPGKSIPALSVSRCRYGTRRVSQDGQTSRHGLSPPQYHRLRVYG
jgi:hypothetical protein